MAPVFVTLLKSSSRAHARRKKSRLETAQKPREARSKTVLSLLSLYTAFSLVPQSENILCLSFSLFLVDPDSPDANERYRNRRKFDREPLITYYHPQDDETNLIAGRRQYLKFSITGCGHVG